MKSRAKSKSGPRPGKPSRPDRTSDENLSVYIEKLTDDGMGLARHQGREALVFGAYPGETVLVRKQYEGQRRIVAKLLKVEKKSPYRIQPSCLMARRCQGCPLIELKYDKQLELKRQKITEAFQGYPALKSIPVRETLGAPETIGYRTTAKLALSKRKGQVRIGIFHRGSHDVADIGGCPLHHPLINRIVEVVREEIERQRISIYDPRQGRGLLRYLTIKVSPELNKAMVTFVTPECDFRQITHLAKWLKKKVPQVVSVHQNVNRSSGNVIFGRETFKMLGAPDLFDQIGETRLRIAPTAFFQVNHRQAQAIYELVRRWADLRPSQTAVDLYCGIGGIALHLARDAGQIIGIEVVEEATRNAQQNARENGLANCQFLAGDVSERMEELAARAEKPAVAVVNPPRKGCDPDVLGHLAALRPGKLIYVSCNPVTLARDLALLSEAGYRIEEVQPVDMFPQTAHIETVVRLVPAAENTSRSGQ